MPYKDNSFEKMELLLSNQDWSFVHGPESVNILMEKFQNTVFQLFDSCFPLKSKTVSSDDQPYWNDELSSLKRKAEREYHKHRASSKYLILHSVYKDRLFKAKKSYFNRKVSFLKKSNSSQWYRQLKKLTRYDQHDEQIQVSDIKHLPDQTTYFSCDQ